MHLVSAYSQQKLLLENTRTGMQKEIRPGDRIKIGFTTAYEQMKVRQQGKVLAITDSTLSYTLPWGRDTVTVALSQITKGGKYNGVGALSLAITTGTLGGLALGLIERNYEENTPMRNQNQASIMATLLTLRGAIPVHNGLNALIYPVRKVNSPGTDWRLKTAL